VSALVQFMGYIRHSRHPVSAGGHTIERRVEAVPIMDNSCLGAE